MKIFLIALFLVASMEAQNFSSRYDVNVSMFGRVGYADITLKESEGSYEAKLVATTVDIAATLLGNRVETFISKGKIVNKKYIPQSFVKSKVSTRKSITSTYIFNHNEKEVTLIEEKTKLVSRSNFNPATFEITTKDVKVESKNESILDDYIADDVLSSYLNTKAGCKNEEKFYALMAIGAHNDENNVTLTCLEGVKKESAMLNFKESAILNFSDNTHKIYNLHVEPFDKDESIVDVLIVYDNDGLLNEALLGEVFWIGKITAKRVYHKLTRN